MNTIYLDHAATTKPDKEVLETMRRVQETCWMNASAAYDGAFEAKKEINAARRAAASLLGTMPQEVYFTSCGTESNNWVFSAFRGKTVLLSAIEHSSVLNAARGQGCRVTLVSPNSQGVIEPDTIEKALTPDTALISVMWANNETGVIQPIKEISQIARSRGITFHTDAVQAFGHIPVDAGLCDYLSVSAHKLYGPKGVGLMYMKQGKGLSALLCGGGQEFGCRSGTENTASIAGFGTAIGLAQADLKDRALREKALTDEMIGLLTDAIPGSFVPGACADRLPGVFSIFLPAQTSEKMIAMLDLRGICVSGGAACAGNQKAHGSTYEAMGIDEKHVIRISVGRHTTWDEILYAARQIVELSDR